MTDDQLLTELCHDLINRVLIMRRDDIGYGLEGFVDLLLTKEAAVRRIMEERDLLRSKVEGLTEDCWRLSTEVERVGTTLGLAVEECTRLGQESVRLVKEAEASRRAWSRVSAPAGLTDDSLTDYIRQRMVDVMKENGRLEGENRTLRAQRDGILDKLMALKERVEDGR